MMTTPALTIPPTAMALTWLEIAWPTFAITFFIVASITLVIFAFRMQRAFRADEDALRRRVSKEKSKLPGSES